MKKQADISDQYFDLPRLSEYSCLGIGTLRDYIKTGLPCFKLKGKLLIRRSEFDQWIEKFRYEKESVKDIADEIMNNLKTGKSDP